MPGAADPVRRSSDQSRWPLVSLAFVAGFVAYFALLPPGLAREFAYCGFGLAATALLLWRVATSTADRIGWTLLLAGVAAWTAGDIVWSVVRLVDPVKDTLEIADVLYVGGYVPLGLGVLRLGRHRTNVRALLDSAILSTAASIGLWLLLVSPALGQPDSDPGGVLAAGLYALGDILLVGVAVRALSSGERPTPSQVTLLAGLVLILVADVLFVPFAVEYSPGSPVDLGWIASYALFGLAAVVPDEWVLPAHLFERPGRRRGRQLAAALATAESATAESATAGTATVEGVLAERAAGTATVECAAPTPASELPAAGHAAAEGGTAAPGREAATRNGAVPDSGADGAASRRPSLRLLLAAGLIGPVTLAMMALRGAAPWDIVVVCALSAVLTTLIVARLQNSVDQLRAAMRRAETEASARALAEGGLRDERWRLQLLLDQLPVVALATDRDLRITSIQGRNLVAPVEDTIGVPLPTFMEALDPSWVSMGAETRALAGESVRIEGAWMDRVYQVALEPLRGADGSVEGIVSISIDVTDSRRLESQLEQARRMEALGLLAGGVAHDFNNVLTAIRGYSELVRDGLPEEHPVHADAVEIVRASERAAQLTQQLLAYSRGQILHPAIVDPNRMIERMVPLLRRIIGDDITVVADTSAGARRIRVDPGQLDQIVLNLAVNARDAMPEGGTLQISAVNVCVDDIWPGAWEGFEAGPGEFVRIRVRDSGCGMSREVREHIFQPFFTTKGVGHGTGLGLATVYGVVRQSGGFIRVDSAPGAGATFDIYLPVTDEREPVASNGHGSPGVVAGSGLTIAIVEDEATISRLVASILERAGYRTIAFSSADEAMSRLDIEWALLEGDRVPSPGPGARSERPAPVIACLVSDVLMPGTKGPAFAARLRETRPDLPVAFISGYAGLDALPSLDSRTAFLTKPFTASELLETIDHVLGALPAAPSPSETSATRR